MEPDVPVHAAEAPEVHVLEVAPVAPPPDPGGNQVAASVQRRRHVELGRHLASLGVPHLVAVHPDGHRRSHAGEVEHHPEPFPLRRQVHPPPVAAHRVRFGVHESRRSGGKAGVEVQRHAVALDLVVGGHGDLPPSVVVVPRVLEARGCVPGPRHPGEAPRAVQRQDPRRRGAALEGRVAVGIRDERRVGGLPAHVDHGGIGPTRLGRGSAGSRHQDRGARRRDHDCASHGRAPSPASSNMRRCAADQLKWGAFSPRPVRGS